MPPKPIHPKPGKPSPLLKALRTRHEAQSPEKRTSFTLRVHRALSWLGRAEDLAADDDLAFVCLWIAFNATYAQDGGQGMGTTSEQQRFRQFINTLCRLDAGKALSALLWQEFSGSIRLLLDNQYVFQPYWDALNNAPLGAEVPDYWREDFEDARQRVHRALAHQDTERVLFEVFLRLYTLRNQLVHGGATWNGSVNRAQVRDGRALLARLLPIMLEVMMAHPDVFEGKPFYPVMA